MVVSTQGSWIRSCGRSNLATVRLTKAPVYGQISIDEMTIAAKRQQGR